jgi:hypothetical protein
MRFAGGFQSSNAMKGIAVFMGHVSITVKRTPYSVAGAA